ncbi:hypothetical protein EGT07_15340 [Herbaspirillum sp. HC18]|nr:hypothetical protein EGT07_15340 [Herbaspirillum sp. HC18]
MDKAWLKEYPPGVPAEIDMSIYASIVDVLEQNFERHASRPAFECMGTKLRFSDIARLTRDFASFLNNVLGLRHPGALQAAADRVQAAEALRIP